MPTTTDYVKTLPAKTIEKIKLDYLNGGTVYRISRDIKLSGGIVNKVLIQTGLYDPHRHNRSAFYIRAEELVIDAYSTDEMDYGYSGQSKYTWQSLNPNERELIKHRNHNELCKLK